MVWEKGNLLTVGFAEKYFELLGERKVRGYLGQEKNYFTEK